MELRQYWNLSPDRREAERRAARRAELETQAQKLHLVIHEGKLIKPEDYPCECEVQSPKLCYEDWHDRPGNKGEKEAVCNCPCHTYYEPF